MPIPQSKADTFLVSCIDPRLTDDSTFHFAALGRTDRYSEMRIAGAALAAVDTARPAWNATLWETLAATRQLHGVRRVTFLNHRDCGAMDLWARRRLADNPADELRVHAEVLTRAAEEVRARHPDMLVELKLMELDGTVRTLPCPDCRPTTLRAEAVAPPEGRAGFADLARLRADAGRLTDADAERALLAEGVTRYGLDATTAREVVARAASGTGRPSPRGAERDVAAFLRSRADRAGRIGRQDLRDAAAMYRRLSAPAMTEADAKRRAAGIATGAGLSPRAEGLLPGLGSTAWFDRLSAPA